MLGMASDSVANVRFNVAKTLSQISTVVPAAALQAQVRPCIEKLNNDSDFDVRYYASEAAMGRLKDIINCFDNWLCFSLLSGNSKK